ncbi:MAG: hypothetical protein P8166_18475, partial [Candidatus Thiodiazotropha sp.]
MELQRRGLVMLRSYTFLISLSMTLFLLQACGGGGGGGEGTNVNVPNYGGLTSQALIDTGNSRDLGTAAASGALQSVVADAANNAMRQPVPKPENKLLQIAPKIAHAIVQSELYYAAKSTNHSDLCLGGSAILNTNDAETVGTVTFSGCGIDDGVGGVIVLTGTVDFSYEAGTSAMSMVFHVRIDYAGESADVNMSISCVNFNSLSPTC